MIQLSFRITELYKPLVYRHRVNYASILSLYIHNIIYQSLSNLCYAVVLRRGE